eukprot:gene18953-22681_t
MTECLVFNLGVVVGESGDWTKSVDYTLVVFTHQIRTSRLCVTIGSVLADFSASDRTALVNQMNNIRGSVQPVPIDGGYQILVWNDLVAQNAANLAAKCGNPFMSDLGAANMYAETVYNFNSEPSAAQVVNRLNEGGSSYNYDDNMCKDGSDCQGYKNMIYYQSTQVGCAKHQCAQSGAGAWRVVCNWNPSGNFPGVRPYIAKAHQSASNMETTNFNGLLKFKSNKMEASNADVSEREVSRINVPGKGSFDWRNKGVVATPEDSRNCGNSAAFTAVGIAQSRVAMKKGVRPNMSKQQIIDCARNQNGCNGGYVNDALLYIRDEGIMKETDYTYQANAGTCRVDKNKIIMKGGYVDFSDAGKDNIIRKCREDGPVGVAMLGHPDFYDYASGIFKCPMAVGTGATNHSVLLVGYNQEQNYYIIRNNWGTGWGENGFAKISANQNEDCGISANRAASLDTTDV